MRGEDGAVGPSRGSPAPGGPGQLRGDFPCASAARSSTNEPSNWQHGNILCSLSSGKRRVRKQRSPVRAGNAGGVPGGCRQPKTSRPLARKQPVIAGDWELGQGLEHPSAVAGGSRTPRCAAGSTGAGPAPPHPPLRCAGGGFGTVPPPRGLSGSARRGRRRGKLYGCS